MVRGHPRSTLRLRLLGRILKHSGAAAEVVTVAGPPSFWLLSLECSRPAGCLFGHVWRSLRSSSQVALVAVPTARRGTQRYVCGKKRVQWPRTTKAPRF